MGAKQPVSVVPASNGDDYLRLATTLLQRMRGCSPTGGVWEAADLQWWWRQDRPTDQSAQLFWLDDQGEPVAAVLMTDFFRSVQCDVLVAAEQDRPGHDRPGHRVGPAEVWQTVLRQTVLRQVAGRAVEFPVRSDDAVALAALAAAGYRPTGETGVVATWLAAEHRPRIPPLAPGYRLVSRAGAADRPHPLAARNGPDVAARLLRCSLYRPELDLAIVAPNGQVAAYGLFWPDLVTGVGLVEPMRTEAAHQGRGIASHLLAVGLDMLAAAGVTRFKVCNDLGIYLRAGFEPLPAVTLVTYGRPARA
jgi:GNAT superfamily N-acetyltransferase